MRTQSEFDDAQQLVAIGLSDSAIARRTGIPRSTVHRWRQGPVRQTRRLASRPPWHSPGETEYGYALGLYLGDGHITVKARSGTLCLSLDRTYPGVIEEAMRALNACFPAASVHRYDHRAERGLAILQVCSPELIPAFPQHGPGRKHLRPIELVPWQLELTHAYPEHLIRGLIHSDGCRTTNRFSTKLPSGRTAAYEYPRYFFSNLSADIRRIFCEHCELLGIHWTQSNPRNISISHRRSVELLDTFVGPKR